MTLKQQARELFDKTFITESSDSTKSGKRLICDPEFAKDFIDSLLNQAVQEEICICAAVKFVKATGEELIIRGHRHGDCFYNKFNRPDKDSWKEKEQGFITSRNRFVTREEGRKLQDEAGILSADPEGYRNKTLFSEDLY